MSKPDLDQAVFLDYAASTPCAPEVIKVMHAALSNPALQSNPSSIHCGGTYAASHIQHAAQSVAQVIKAQPEDLIWTSGATEAINLALKGAAFAYRHLGNHIITSQAEHAATLSTCAYLKRHGFDITYLKPNQYGCIDPHDIEKAIKENTILISFLHINHETGSINDIHSIAAIAKKLGVICHIDAAQSIGKAVIDMTQMPIDLCSFSAHKTYGPKGIGALYRRTQPHSIQLKPQIHGGKQQNNQRSGTLPTPLIIGMATAFTLAHKQFLKDKEQIAKLSSVAWHLLYEHAAVLRNGKNALCVDHILNIYVPEIHGEALMAAIAPFVLCSQSSSCNAAQGIPSPVLQAMGRSLEQAQASIRLSFGRNLNKRNLDKAIRRILCAIQTLKYIAGKQDKPKEKWLLAHTDAPINHWFLNTHYVGFINKKNGDTEHIISFQHKKDYDIQWQWLEHSHNKTKSLHYNAYGPPEILAACAWIADYVNQKSIHLVDIKLDCLKIAEALSCPMHKQHRIHCAHESFTKLINTIKN
jgi:cysteine desulfurase